MTSPALKERREVVAAARREAEMAQRFHDKQWHKRHRVRPKPLSLEQPTNEAHIALYRAEKGKSEARRAPIIAAALEQVRDVTARLEPEADERSRKRQERVNARNTERAKAFKTHFKCGHERSIENTKYHTPRRGVSGLRPPIAECMICITARNKRRDRKKRSSGVTAGMPTAYGA